jgi:hypothetical protein
MEKKLVEEYEKMLPSTETMESVVAKGKLEPVLIDAKLKLAGIKKADFTEWEKNPEEYVCKHDQKRYEELICVGYHPQLRELKAVMNIKLPYGYGGNCPKHPGSMQYVRFYLDWTNDGLFTGWWEDQGIGSVHVFDPGAANDRKLPLEYAVQKRLDLPGWLWDNLEGKCCVRRVRAILSWSKEPPPIKPKWKPFWGNVFETNIRFHK